MRKYAVKWTEQEFEREIMGKGGLKYDEEILIVEIGLRGVTHYEDITSYFENSNAYDDWLDNRIAKKV